MSEAFVNDLYGRGLLDGRPFDLQIGGTRAKLMPVPSKEVLFRRVDISQRLKAVEARHANKLLIVVRVVLISRVDKLPRLAIVTTILPLHRAILRIAVAVVLASIVAALLATAVVTASASIWRATLALAAHLRQSSSIRHAFHLGVHSSRVLHALPDLCLYEVLVDLVHVDLWQLLEILNGAVRHVLLARLDDDEDMLEELPHHLLHRVHNTHVETVEGKLQHGAVV